VKKKEEFKNHPGRAEILGGKDPETKDEFSRCNNNEGKRGGQEGSQPREEVLSTKTKEKTRAQGGEKNLKRITG